eukprot:8444384-Pyramimonas_sp.AAC.1
MPCPRAEPNIHTMPQSISWWSCWHMLGQLGPWREGFGQCLVAAPPPTSLTEKNRGERLNTTVGDLMTLAKALGNAVGWSFVLSWHPSPFPSRLESCAGRSRPTSGLRRDKASSDHTRPSCHTLEYAREYATGKDTRP